MDENAYIMRDGKLFFCKFKIEVTTAGGGPYYAVTSEEKEEIARTLRGKHDFKISTRAQTADELFITTACAVNSIGEFRAILTDKETVKKIMLQKLRLLTAYEQLESGYGIVDAETSRKKAEVDRLKKFYEALP